MPKEEGTYPSKLGMKRVDEKSSVPLNPLVGVSHFTNFSHHSTYPMSVYVLCITGSYSGRIVLDRNATYVERQAGSSSES